MKTNSNVLIALALHEKPEDIIKILDLIKDEYKSKIYLFHIIEEMPRISFYSDAYIMWEEFRDRAIKNTLQGMNIYLEKLKEKYNDVEILVEVGPAVKRIVEKAEELKSSILVVGTHTRKGLGHLIHSNIAENIIRLTKISVMTFHLEKE